LSLHHLQVKIAAGIGAEFDYFAGTKIRPPQWISTVGLQWLHRLFTQPSTWQRTVVSVPIFMGHVINDWLKIKLSKLKT
jgi:N-acetylglucosaminyldiphosphoundecaprenol N-acetyl-beta-D-mannosaminyltransferase